MTVHIQLLMHHAENQRLLEEWLSQSQPAAFTVCSSDNCTDVVDLIIVDERQFVLSRREIEQARQQQIPVLLPVLLMLSARSSQSPEQLAHDPLVDDFIMLPVEKSTLLIRIRNLLKVRDLTQQMRARTAEVVTMSHAIASTGDVVILLDEKREITYYNQAALSLFDIDTNTSEAITAQLHEQLSFLQDKLDRVQSHDQAWHGEIWLTTRKDRLITVLLRIDWIKDGSDSRSGLVLSLKDITEVKRLEAAEREQRILSDALREIALTLTSTLNLDQVFDRVLDNVKHIVGYDCAAIMLVREQKIVLVKRQGFSFNDLYDESLKMPYSLSQTQFLQYIAATGDTMIVSDLLAEGVPKLFKDHIQMRSYLGVAIQVKGEVIGFINLFYSMPGFYTQIHVNRLEAIAVQAAVAIQNARLYERAQSAAALEERQRLARDFHDSVSQALFSARMITETIPRAWPNIPEDAESLLAELHQLMRGALAETRTLLLELKPTKLLELELSELLKQLTESLWSRKSLVIEQNIIEEIPLSMRLKVAFYRIAQEALNNVVKHSQAKTVKVYFHSDNSAALLRIEDDGVGFNPQRIDSKGMGLSIMAERAEAVGIEFAIQSEADEGTVVQVQWQSEKELPL